MLTIIAVTAALLTTPIPTTAAPDVHVTGIRPSDTCSILTNEGHCPVAGQFCRDTDLGKSTTNADGREIDCVQDGLRGHWEYGN